MALERNAAPSRYVAWIGLCGVQEQGLQSSDSASSRKIVDNY